MLIALVAMLGLRNPKSTPVTSPIPAPPKAAPASKPFSVPEPSRSTERSPAAKFNADEPDRAPDTTAASRYFSDNSRETRWTRSSWEEFMVRSVDPLFRKSDGWKVYNPDQLDGVLETARRPALFAFSVGLKFNRSF